MRPAARARRLSDRGTHSAPTTGFDEQLYEYGTYGYGAVAPTLACPPQLAPQLLRLRRRVVDADVQHLLEPRRARHDGVCHLPRARPTAANATRHAMHQQPAVSASPPCTINNGAAALHDLAAARAAHGAVVRSTVPSAADSCQRRSQRPPASSLYRDDDRDVVGAEEVLVVLCTSRNSTRSIDKCPASAVAIRAAGPAVVVVVRRQANERLFSG